MSKQLNKSLLQTILTKRQNSEPLNNEEEAYAREVFSDMMDSKKQVRKVVRIVTGEQLRKESNLEKAKVDADATRKDPRYPQGKNPAKITQENTDPDIDELKGGKIPDADLKPKMGPVPGYEQERLSNYLQEAIPPRSEAAKFVSADPVSTGDIVSKNMAREGQHIVKGIVLKVKDDVAFVKWADGRTMYEPAHLLVKVKKADAAAAASEVKEDPKLGPSKDEEHYKNPPMKKQGRRTIFTPRGSRTRNVIIPSVEHATARAGLSGTGRRGDPVSSRLGPVSARRLAGTERAVTRGLARAGVYGTGGRKSPVRIPAGSAKFRALGGRRKPQKMSKVRTSFRPGGTPTKGPTPRQRQQARAIGRRIGGAINRAGSAVSSAVRRGHAARVRRGVMSQPGKHAFRAVRSLVSPKPNVGRAIRETARAVGSAKPAREARTMDRAARRQFGMFGPKVKRPYGQTPKRKMQKDGDIAAATNYGGSVAPSMPDTTPFQDLTNSLQDVIRLAGELKSKQERTDNQDVKNYYDTLISKLREIAETILSGLNMELDEASAEADNDNS